MSLVSISVSTPFLITMAFLGAKLRSLFTASLVLPFERASKNLPNVIRQVSWQPTQNTVPSFLREPLPYLHDPNNKPFYT